MPGLFIAVVLTLIAGVLVLNFTTGEKKIEQSVERLYATADPAFARAMGVLLGPAILQGNRFEALLNGDRIFPAMLASIRDARKSITFESYIYWSDAIGKEFADALAERARAGVKVHVLLDWVGSNKMDPTHLAVMEAAGVEVRKFHKPAWYSLARMNNRTHRKVLVVDGKVGSPGVSGSPHFGRGIPRIRTLARHPLQGSRSDRGANAGRISRQLDQGYRCRPAW